MEKLINNKLIEKDNKLEKMTLLTLKTLTRI